MAAALVGWLRVLLSIVLLAAVATAPNIALAAPDWKIAVEPSPKIRVNYPSEMRVRISDAKGQPVSGASVELITNMIDMDHGEHKSPTTMTARIVHGSSDCTRASICAAVVRVAPAPTTLSISGAPRMPNR